MHTPVKQATKLKMSNFDFHNYELKKFDSYFLDIKKNPFKNSLDLGYLSIKPLERLKNIVSDEFLDKLYKAAQYTCPFNGYRHHCIVPVSILTDNPLYYIKKHHVIVDDSTRTPWYTDMACDPTWNKDEEITETDQYLSSVILCAMGSGYTQTFYPNDGHFSHDVLGIEIDNGDILLFLVMKWYNK